MILKELISTLQAFDPNLTVMVDGYEGGLKDQFTVRQDLVYLNNFKEGYYGPHAPQDEACFCDAEEKAQAKTVQALIISRHVPKETT